MIRPWLFLLLAGLPALTAAEFGDSNHNSTRIPGTEFRGQ